MADTFSHTLPLVFRMCPADSCHKTARDFTIFWSVTQAIIDQNSLINGSFNWTAQAGEAWEGQQRLDPVAGDKRYLYIYLWYTSNVHRYRWYIKLSGWLFGTFGLFFHILGMSSSQLTFTHIFQGGRSTTKQL